MQVVTDPAAAKEVGERGAVHVRTHYNPATIAQVCGPCKKKGGE